MTHKPFQRRADDEDDEDDRFSIGTVASKFAGRIGSQKFGHQRGETEDEIRRYVDLAVGRVDTLEADATLTPRQGFVGVDATQAAITVTLPVLDSTPIGTVILVKKLDAVANDVTVETFEVLSDGTPVTIDGVNQKTLSSQYATLRLVRAEKEWWVV